MENLMNVLFKFGLGSNILRIERINSGHINKTYKIIYSDNESYILQKVNKKAIKNPKEIMFNINLLYKYVDRKYPEFLECEGKNFAETEEGFWRGYRYIENSAAYEKMPDLKSVYEFGRTLGKFHLMTESACAEQFYAMDPDFHNTYKRIKKLKYYESEKYCNEFAFFNNVKKYVFKLTEKNLPVKVTHNDVKCSNVLLEKETHDGICLIDFDSVMSGLYVYDFGDGARSGCITDNLFDINKFKKYAEGYFSMIRLYKPEDYFLGMICITAELAARYFYDFLSGENYFKDKTSVQKLSRCLELIETAKSIESSREEIESVIKACLK
ncbi:phosphotransferase [Porcipelethomonas sp.]|uniref:phosphotransferase enzyme family protein n=1 Tax=Porcipelethomonas sp. TaxID=2981675 RepID=UPI003076DCFC